MPKLLKVVEILISFNIFHFFNSSHILFSPVPTTAYTRHNQCEKTRVRTFGTN
ncbi:hypothetical protein Hanom_Chr04g00294081 [Helianthus anomalus]